MAAAWATLVTQLVIVALNLRLVLPRIGGRLPGVERLVRSALAATAMGFVAWALARAGVEVLIVGLASLVAYAGFSLGLGAVRPAELRAMVRREADVLTG